MFKGGDSGFIRFSDLDEAVPGNPSESPWMWPSIAVKLLRDGHDSANFVCMFSVDGQDSLNWFENDFVNHIPDPKSIALKPLSARFATQTDWI